MDPHESQRAFETKILSVTLLSPLQIKNTLILEAANGWELVAIGTNYAFLLREISSNPPDIAYYIESITLSLPHQIKGALQEHGAQGWAVGGIGSNYLFMKRARNRPIVPREYEMESVTIRGIRGVEQIIARRAEQGWGLCSLGKNFAFFERLKGQKELQVGWEHKSLGAKSVSITLKTPHQMKEILEEEAEDGWQLCAVGTSFMFLRRSVTWTSRSQLIHED